MQRPLWKDRLDYFTAEADEKSEPRGRLTLNEVEKLEAGPEDLRSSARFAAM